jgi:hypothetical protein
MMYDSLPYPILLILRRGLRDDVETCQKIQATMRLENDSKAEAVWKSNEAFYQEHLDMVQAVIDR